MRQQIDETRAALANKVEALKERVMHNGQATQTCVDETIQTVKQTVHDTVETIKRTFDLKQQVARHPWPMLGGAVVLGILLAKRSQSHPSPALAKQDNGHAADDAAPPRERAKAPVAAVHTEPTQPGFKPWIKAQFHDELNNLQTVAITAGVSIFRDWIKRLMPDAKDDAASR
jgi:hypothetical protein